jgi:hypothetical protein
MDGKKWREEPKPLTPQLIAALQEVMEKLSSGTEVDASEVAEDMSNVGMVRMDREVNLRKGSFWLGPKSTDEDQ